MLGDLPPSLTAPSICDSMYLIRLSSVLAVLYGLILWSTWTHQAEPILLAPVVCLQPLVWQSNLTPKEPVPAPHCIRFTMSAVHVSGALGSSARTDGNTSTNSSRCDMTLLLILRTENYIVG